MKFNRGKPVLFVPGPLLEWFMVNKSENEERDE